MSVDGAEIDAHADGRNFRGRITPYVPTTLVVVAAIVRRNLELRKRARARERKFALEQRFWQPPSSYLPASTSQVKRKSGFEAKNRKSKF